MLPGMTWVNTEEWSYESNRLSHWKQSGMVKSFAAWKREHKVGGKEEL